MKNKSLVTIILVSIVTFAALVFSLYKFVLKEKTSQTSTTLKIGLMYTSDYGYAMNNGPKNNWLFTKGYEWTMTAYSSSYPVGVDASGGLFGDVSAYNGFAVRPVLYLKSNVYVISGDGSEGNPYKIMLG